MFCKFQAVCNILSVICYNIYFIIGKNRVDKISPAQDLVINGESWIHTQAAESSVPPIRFLLFRPAIMKFDHTTLPCHQDDKDNGRTLRH